MASSRRAWASSGKHSLRPRLLLSSVAHSPLVYYRRCALSRHALTPVTHHIPVSSHPVGSTFHHASPPLSSALLPQQHHTPGPVLLHLVSLVPSCLPPARAFANPTHLSRVDTIQTTTMAATPRARVEAWRAARRPSRGRNPRRSNTGNDASCRPHPRRAYRRLSTSHSRGSLRLFRRQEQRSCARDGSVPSLCHASRAHLIQANVRCVERVLRPVCVPVACPLPLASDDEDFSWKVRRAAARCLLVIVQTRPDLLRHFLATVAGELVARFKGKGWRRIFRRKAPPPPTHTHTQTH